MGKSVAKGSVLVFHGRTRFASLARRCSQAEAGGMVALLNQTDMEQMLACVRIHTKLAAALRRCD